MTSVKVTKTMDSDKPKNCEPYKKRIIILNQNQNYLRIISERKIRGKHVVTNALQCWGEYKEPPLWRRILILVGRARRSIRVNFHKDWGRRKKRKNAAAYDQPGSNVHEVSLMLVNVANWSRSWDCPIWSGKFCNIVFLDRKCLLGNVQIHPFWFGRGRVKQNVIFAFTRMYPPRPRYVCTPIFLRRRCL